MKLNFIKSQSSVKPDLIDTTSSKKNVYIRQNITETQIENSIFYEYEEAKLSKEEYQKYIEEINCKTTLESIETLKSENKTLIEQIDMLTNCILELSETVYK